MTHFFLNLMLISFFAFSQVSASSEEESPTSTLKVTCGHSFRQPTKEDFAALPSEKIDARITSSRGPDGRVKVEYEPTTEPLTLQRLCEGLRVGHVFTFRYEWSCDHFWAFIASARNEKSDQQESCFKGVSLGYSSEYSALKFASDIFTGATEFIEWPHHACLSMKPVEGVPDTFMMHTLPSPSYKQLLSYLEARESVLSS